VISFGENDLFTQPRNPPESRLRRYQNAIQKIISFAPVPFFGRLFVLPHQKPINTIGKISFDVNNYYLFQAYIIQL
jgi:2-acylglycerol O-acyltransferase 2